MHSHLSNNNNTSNGKTIPQFYAFQFVICGDVSVTNSRVVIQVPHQSIHKQHTNVIIIVDYSCAAVHCTSFHIMYMYIGYEPADLTVHPPPSQTIEGGFIFSA